MREWVWLQLADPQVSFAMLLLGATGVVWECAAPRSIAPGVAGLVLAVLALVALPKLIAAWVLLLLGALILALGARTGYVWIGISWASALFTAAGARWNVALPQAILCSVPFAILTGLLWRISYRAVANKRL